MTSAFITPYTITFICAYIQYVSYPGLNFLKSAKNLSKFTNLHLVSLKLTFRPTGVHQRWLG